MLEEIVSAAAEVAESAEAAETVEAAGGALEQGAEQSALCRPGREELPKPIDSDIIKNGPLERIDERPGKEELPRPEIPDNKRPRPEIVYARSDKKELPQTEKTSDTASKTKDAKEEKDVDEKQRAAIKEGIERILKGEELSTAEKGNLCEMMMDQYYISKGYTPLHERVTSLDDKGHQGIDGVYEKDGKYVIADAKFGTARLGETQDGKQMSAEWIDKRLDDAVGKEKADEIRDAYEDDPDNVKNEVYNYDPKADSEGNTYSNVYSVDETGEKCGDRVQADAYNHEGDRVKKGDEMDA